MKLLEEIENKLKKHPLVNESLETKMNYLLAIAYFILIDEEVTNNEKDSFDEIISLLNCNDMKEDLYDFIENPNSEDFEEIFKFIINKNYFIVYILEIYFLDIDKKMNLSEERFINIIFRFTDYSRNEIEILIKLIQSCINYNRDDLIKNMNKIIKNNKLYNEKEIILKFYKLNDLFELLQEEQSQKAQQLEKLLEIKVLIQNIRNEYL